MTTPAKAPSGGAAILVNLLLTLAIWAFLTWLAGIALHQGFGVSVPFTPVFLMSLAAATAVKVLVAMTAQVWHAERVKADLALLTAVAATQASETG
jgi:hypothetical protein